jgi:glycosyltransferase involved in cell wall biosynthesis
MENNPKLIIFDTHPIQYRAPVFKELAKKLPSLKVFFFNSDFDGSKWWFHEVGKAKALAWGINLTEGYSSETLQTNSLKISSIYKKLKATLVTEQPQAVLVYGYYLKEHWILRLLCSQLHIPLIFVGETFTSNSSWLRKTITTPLQNFFLKGVKRFISIGKKTEAFYLSKKISPSKIISGHYCVDTDFFKKEEPQASERRKRLREQLGIKESDFVLLFVGRLFEIKRPQDLISLHELLLPKEKVHTVIIGSGPLEGSLKSQCEEMPRLHWLGFQNQIETRDWYFASDLLIVPSEFETWGLVINEAFSCGLPALVSNSCGAAEDLVENGQTGFVYEVGSIESALKCVTSLLQNPSLQKEMGEKARNKILDSYRPDQFADSILQAFLEVPVSTY